MNIIGKSIDYIDENDIKRLISNQISENKTLEYKRDLNIENSDEKKEFLYDISSIANTEGGVIIFGIEEQKDIKGKNTGIPATVTGIHVENQDKLIQKIEDIIKNNIEPQLNTLKIKFIKVDLLDVLIIGIPKLLWLPYMVTYNSTNKFYKRRNSGKYLLDVYELNHLFMRSQTFIEEANKFRENRIQEVRELKFIPKLDIEGSFFLHVIPLGHLGENIIDISNDAKLNYLKETLRPIRSNGYDFRHNIDGFMTFASDFTNKIPFSYVQLFRDCSIEFYTSHLHYSRKDEPDKLDIAGYSFETISIECITEAFRVLSLYQIEPPYAVYISLLDLDNAVVFLQTHWNEKTDKIGKSKLLFPAVVFNDLSQDLYKTMKSTFDILWQAGNFPKSPFYDGKDERIKQNK